MTNLDRLKLAMADRLYYTEAEYGYLLQENGLEPINEYASSTDKEGLLKTQLEILQSLANNIDYYRSIETEFANTSEAYKALSDRIQDIQSQISMLPNYEPEVSKINYLYSN
jgi:hypothetical protein